MVEHILKRRYELFVIGILLLATVLRFVNYGNRWGLAHDQARDAIMGRLAVSEHLIPEVGPFTQAGSVVMGPLWYWLVALATFVYPAHIMTPWVVLTFSFVLVVFVMIGIGRELESDLVFSLILGLLTALSPSQVLQSTNLTNPSGVAIFSALALYTALLYIRKGECKYIFLYPFFISLAINTHLQAVGLIWLFLVPFFLRRPTLSQVFIAVLGFGIPFLSILPFELKSHFYDTRNLIRYVLYDQYTMYFPNRWLTYLGVFWPDVWTKIVGGFLPVSYITLGTVSVLSVMKGAKRELSKSYLLVLITFSLIVMQLRFFRGVKFDSYLLFLHPFALALAAWVIYMFYAFNRKLGIVLLLVFAVGSLFLTIPDIIHSSTYTQVEVRTWQKAMADKFPGQKFAVYDYKYRHTGKSVPLVLFSSMKNCNPQ
ncbi:hypothetical protein HY947_00750 [Candidatus Gottesmanbacteria bacterium]|nr:hypothetical protein [Candidatus Gottesmanbacteria bacterium]